MSTSFERLMSCADLRREHVVAALRTREGTHSLFVRLARVARPGDRTDRVLLVLASIAGGHADWFDSDLRVEIEPQGTGTVVHTLVDLGTSHRERLFPSYAFDVPYAEFEGMISETLRQLTPLEILPSSRGIVLSTLDDDGAWGDERIEVSESSIAADSRLQVESTVAPDSARPTTFPVSKSMTEAPATPLVLSLIVVPPAPRVPTEKPRSVPRPDPNGGRPTREMKIVIPAEARRDEGPRFPATVRTAASSRAELLGEHALQSMAGRATGINPLPPKFVKSAEVLADAREDGRDSPTPLLPRAMDEEVYQGLLASGDRERPSKR